MSGNTHTSIVSLIVAQQPCRGSTLRRHNIAWVIELKRKTTEVPYIPKRPSTIATPIFAIKAPLRTLARRECCLGYMARIIVMWIERRVRYIDSGNVETVLSPIRLFPRIFSIMKPHYCTMKFLLSPTRYWSGPSNFSSLIPVPIIGDF